MNFILSFSTFNVFLTSYFEEYNDLNYQFWRTYEEDIEKMKIETAWNY